MRQLSAEKDYYKMSLLKRGIISLLISALLTMTLAASSSATTLPFRLTWDRNAEADVAFYTVYYGATSRNYTHFIDTTTPTDLQQNPHADFCDRTSPDCDPSYAQITPGTYYITVTATDYALNESDFSSEVVAHIDPSPASSTTTSTIRPTTTSPSTTTTTSPADRIIYENAEDRTTGRWYIYDDLPSGAEIRNVYDDDRQSRVIQLSSYGIDNGFRLKNSDGERWHNSSHFTIQWSTKYSEDFAIYIDLETTAGHRYLTYTPHDFNNLGYGEYVEHGLGSDAINGQWHTFVRDLRADLASSQPGVRILEVNGFLIRGSGLVDDIMLHNDSPSSDTTTSIASEGDEHCSRDPQLQLNGSPPEEGTMSIVIPAGSLPQHSLSYEDAEDQDTGRWYIYDDSPGGAQIRNVYDDGRRSRVMEFTGSGADNGYRLKNSDGTLWNNDSHFIIKWSMKYSELFTVYVDLETTEGHRYLTYRPNDYNSLGNDEYVMYGLGENAKDGKWHTYVRDLQADLAVAQPGVTILEVNGFLIRGSGKVDDITLITFEETISPNLHVTLFDADTSGEGNMYVNGNGPIAIPTANYNNSEHTFQIPINSTCLTEGENSFRFTHVADQGYEVRGLCLDGLLTYPPSTTTIPPTTTSTPSSSTTTTTNRDTTPPTGRILINQGAATTDCQLVTLNLSAEDTGSGMGEGAQMMFSKHEKKHWSDPMPFETTKSWTLSPGKGERMVYVKFSDAAGNWMEEPVNDSIMINSFCKESSTLKASSLATSSGFLSSLSGMNPLKDSAHVEWLSPLRLFQREEYLIVDLGETQVVTRVDLVSNRFLSLDLFPQDFEIQASDDKKNWVTLFTVENYASPPSHLESWTFEEIETRYIKMHVTRVKPFLFFFYRTYVKDIAVYGCANSQRVNPELHSSSGTGQTETTGIERSFTLPGKDEIPSGQNSKSAGSQLPADPTGVGRISSTGKAALFHDGSSRKHGEETSEIICDNGGPSTSFTGIWDQTNEYDCYETSSLVAEQSATYSWRPDILDEGSYAVSMWWSAEITNCNTCPVDITCNGELKDTLYIDQRQGGGQWNLLGIYNLEAGNDCSVTITAEGPGFKTCADAVKFVRLGESSPETQIDYVHPNPALPDEEICFSGQGIPDNQMSIQGYRWVSHLDGEIGTADSFCTSSLSEGIHRISYTIQNDDGVWSTPAEKRVSIVNILKPSQNVWIEAEEGTLNWPMETEWNDNASNGEYAWVPHESGNGVNPEEDGGHAEYSFELSDEGNFLVWGRVLTSGSGDDSFWISMDNSPWILWDTPPGNEGNWVWGRVSNRGGSDPVVYHLDAGVHTLVIKNREDGAKIDRILITNDLIYNPTGQGN